MKEYQFVLKPPVEDDLEDQNWPEYLSLGFAMIGAHGSEETGSG
jgi:hypothetical protein